MSSVRCFVAADLTAEAREDLGRLQDRLRRAGLECRWAAPEALHLTLKFLGEVSPETFAALREALALPLGVGGPLHLAAAGVGAFPSPQRVRVVWAGLTGDVAPLARAALTVEARVEPLGIAQESRPFRPHLTLGRARNPEGIRGAQELLAAEGPYRGPEFSVSGLVLYESRLRPQGPEHLPRLAIAL